MPIGKLVFAQLMDFLPLHTFRRCVARYPSNYPTKTFSHLDQYLSMAFAQLTFRESLRDIEVCLRAHEAKLYHLGIRGHVARSNLGDANEKRDWRIYRDFANSLIAQARRLYADDAFAVDLDNTVYALDTTTIDLSLKVFPWAHFRKAKAAVKMHTQIDLRGNIPSFIHVSDGKMHEVNVLDLMTPEPGSFSIMDRGFLDFARLYRLTQAGAFFVIRPKSNTAFQRVYSRSVDKTTGLRCDQTVRLTGVTSANDHPQYLRYVVFYDAHSTVKCNGQISGAEENLARGLVAEYLSGARVEFVLDPLDIGIGQNREVGTFWEVLPEEAVSVFVEAAFPRVIGLGKIG